LGGWENMTGSNVTISVGQTWSADGTNWAGAKMFPNAKTLAMSGDCGAFVTFKTSADEKISVRTGISLVSEAGARRNLEQELSKPFGWDFAAVVQNQRNAWNDIFNRVEIETPNAREKTRFYSNLYRALSGRNTWSDVDGRWIDPADRVQKLSDPADVMLGCDALWTTFWNLNQVMNLLAPEWSARWTKSELQLYEKCGWLAKGPAGLKYISVMVAEHEIPLMVAAYQSGISGLNGKKFSPPPSKCKPPPPNKPPVADTPATKDWKAILNMATSPWTEI
jgi:putative alpha-1,2-mannosidase